MAEKHINGNEVTLTALTTQPSPYNPDVYRMMVSLNINLALLENLDPGAREDIAVSIGREVRDLVLHTLQHKKVG